MIDFNKKGIFAKLKKTNKIPSEIEELMIDGESAIGSYTCVTNHVVFTNKRIIAVYTPGGFISKSDYTSIPYSKIQTFSVETAGLFGADCDLEIYISSIGKIKFEFIGTCDIKSISRTIAEYAMR